MWHIDRESDIPVYRQIADDLERRIMYGELPPGSVLPSERKLAQELKVNRSTIVQAYDELLATGLIESHRGSGRKVGTTHWGISPLRTPNWRQYAEGGSFLPNLPVIRKIRHEKQHRSTLIDMAGGELSPDLFPAEALKRMTRELDFAGSLGYADPQGDEGLRARLVSYLYDYHRIRTTEDSILVTSGSQQSLYLIAQCLLSPGDAVAVEAPSYYFSLPMFQSAGLRFIRLPVDGEGICPDDIPELHRKHRLRMIIVNPNYQNPTGTVMSAERRLRLLELAAEHGIPIVEDDPFSLTAFDEAPPLPLKALDRSSSVLYIGSMSKIVASGLRIGWLVAPQTIVQRLADARQQMDFGLSVLPQWLAAQYVGSEPFGQHLTQLREALRRKRDLTVAILERELAGEISFSVPKGGLNLWCSLHGEVDDSQLLEASIRRGILYTPGSVFGSGPGHARFAYARPREAELARGLAAFAEAWRAVRG
ncbi:MocR-like pyridoxine biosynthesis transcription factor PdxR [Paenibacillus cremeus]|uniref:PLP-dependent aminotransferase family protein n=1 Tax=Paenibacillus cremeus TaxID=2163881 RepID=A0A559K3N0_9BACL|nr:PLP-dependent aminotransferase family protein [Paenibacillus cremeus]TVY06707.1 PLP-dependent aminotransferase family protein [Paenibacillus cremeus]